MTSACASRKDAVLSMTRRAYMLPLFIMLFLLPQLVQSSTDMTSTVSRQFAAKHNVLRQENRQALPESLSERASGASRVPGSADEPERREAPLQFSSHFDYGTDIAWEYTPESTLDASSPQNPSSFCQSVNGDVPRKLKHRGTVDADASGAGAGRCTVLERQTGHNDSIVGIGSFWTPGVPLAQSIIQLQSTNLGGSCRWVSWS